MWIGALILMGLAWRRRNGTLQNGIRLSGNYLLMMLPRLTIALLLAGFAAELLPQETMSAWLGHESGLRGILLASVAGLFVPAGGVVAFPLALAMIKIGVGLPQLIAFLTAWEVFAIHRILAWEMPFLGGGFVALRLASSFMLPPLAGIIGAGMVSVFDV